MAAVGDPARLGGRRRAAAAAARARRLGRRGGRALRPQPVRELGVLGLARPGRGPRAQRRERDQPRRRARRQRRSRSAPFSKRASATRSRPPTSSSTSSRARCSRPRECPVSAVAGCAGVERLRLRFEGQAAHAGTTPMDRRRDAGLAAAEAALAIERIGSAARRRRDDRLARARARDRRPRSPASPSSAAICATPTPARSPSMLAESRAPRRRRPRRRRGCDARRGADLADRAARVRSGARRDRRRGGAARRAGGPSR